MKHHLISFAFAAAFLSTGAAQIPYADYRSGTAPVTGHVQAAVFQAENHLKLADATAPDKLAAFVSDEVAARALLGKLRGAYATCPVAATQVAAVSQWVMEPDAWYCLFWDGEHAAGRKVWAKALLTFAKESADAYVRELCLDQLRWCGLPCQAECLRKLAAGEKDKAVREMAELVAATLEGGECR